MRCSDLDTDISNICRVCNGVLSKEIYGRASRSCTLPFFAGIHRSYLLFRGEPAGWYPMKSIFLPPWNGTILPPCANTKGKGTIISRFPTVRKRIAADFSTGRGGGGWEKRSNRLKLLPRFPKSERSANSFFFLFFFSNSFETRLSIQFKKNISSLLFRSSFRNSNRFKVMINCLN